MSGSLAHIIGKDGKFRMDLIENGGDAQEALEDCFEVIVHLAEGDMQRVSAACKAASVADPYCPQRTLDDPMPAIMEGSAEYGSPWPLHEVLKRLITATEYCLHVHGTDRTGYEMDGHAVAAARAMLKRWGHEEPPPLLNP